MDPETVESDEFDANHIVKFEYNKKKKKHRQQNQKDY